MTANVAIPARVGLEHSILHRVCLVVPRMRPFF
jgi:hypothetical protein